MHTINSRLRFAVLLKILHSRGVPRSDCKKKITIKTKVLKHLAINELEYQIHK